MQSEEKRVNEAELDRKNGKGGALLSGKIA
jgi:hypothetical protein